VPHVVLAMLIFALTNFFIILFSVIFVFVVVAYSLQARRYRKFKGISFIRYLIYGVRSRSFLFKISEDNDVKFVKWIFPLFPSVIAIHPDSIKWVLSNPHLFPKMQAATFKAMRKLIAQNILNANGAEWHKFRTALSPPFRYDIVKNWVDDFRETSLELLNIWATQMDKPIDVLQWLPQFTLDVLGKTTFSREFNAMNGTKNEYFQTFSNLITRFGHRKTALAVLVERITGFNFARDIERASTFLYNFILDVIDTKRKVSDTTGRSMDIVDMMLAFHNPPFTTDEVISNAFIMFAAGHETTATALSWMFYNLGTHLDIQKKAVAEVWNVLKGKKVTGDDLSKLEYLNMVIKENLRIRPPVTLMLGRVAAQDVEFEGYKIPKGTRIGIGIEIVHSNPRYWPNPKEFIPERFASEQNHTPFTYLPFSLQTRICLGKHFSLVEQLVFAATLLQHFTWTIHSCNVDEPYSVFLNKPKELKVKLQRIEPQQLSN
jgi:cytochrome P450